MRDDIEFTLGEIMRIEDEIERLMYERDQLLGALDDMREAEACEDPSYFKTRYGVEGFRRDVDRFFGEGLRRDARRFFGPP